MLTKEELLELIQDIESSRAERTVSVNDTDKFCEAVYAFVNACTRREPQPVARIGTKPFIRGLTAQRQRTNLPPAPTK